MSGVWYHANFYLCIYRFSFRRIAYLFSYLIEIIAKMQRKQRTNKSKPHQTPHFVLLCFVFWQGKPIQLSCNKVFLNSILHSTFFLLSEFPFFQERCLGKTENNKLSLNSPCWPLSPSVIFSHAAWQADMRNDKESSQNCHFSIKIK